MKKLWITLLAVVLLLLPTQQAEAVAYDPSLSYEALDVRFWNDEAPPLGFYINAASRYILETVPAPRMGSTYGEWSVMDLLRAHYTGYDFLHYIPKNYFNDYVQRINGYVVSKAGNLDRNKSTEWSRLALSLSALGQDIRQVGIRGDYIKVTAAVQGKDGYTIESNNLSSLSALPINNGAITVQEPVGVYTTAGDYVLLQSGTYRVTQRANDIQLSGAVNVVLPSSQYVHVEQPYNFVERMSQSHRFSYRQGINGPIWVILAMNTGGYELLSEQELAARGVTVANGDVNTIGKMIDYILAREITTSAKQVGGWALSGNNPDADITGMALQAFAPYYLDAKKYVQTGATATYAQFQAAVERGVLALHRIQQPNGGFGSWGTFNSESTVQVIVALTALQMDPLASITLPALQQTISFVTAGDYADGVWTNNMLDALLTFFAASSGSSDEVGGFKHVTTGYDGGGGSGTSVNAMATDQALYGLLAYDRFKKGLAPLYDMTDMINGEYKQMQAKTYTVTFVDGEKRTTKQYAPYAVITLPTDVPAWNAAQHLQGTRYVAGERLVMPEQAITLYADHAPNELNTAAINKVIRYIQELPNAQTITKQHKHYVDRAFASYRKLSEQEQTKVSNYAKLLEVEAKMNEQLAQYDDELKVTNLMQTITSLQQVPVISRDYEVAIRNARMAYNNLTAKQRQLITNRDVLDELEGALAIAIETEQGITWSMAAIEEAIRALPAAQQLTLQQAADVFKIASAIKTLPAQQQATVIGNAKLNEAITQIRTLQAAYLQTEQLEDELANDTYGQLTVIGNTLHVTAPRTTGTFQVRVAVQTLQQALTSQVEKVVFSDVRGVTFTVAKDDLMKQLANEQGELILQVSQLSAAQQFSVQWRLSTGETLMSSRYMTLTIPYSYFVNGQQLASAQVVKLMDGEKATSHTSTAAHVTLNVRAGATYAFTRHELQFSDVRAENATDLLYLANRLVITGRQDGTFGPNEAITRGQFAAMINRALGLEPTMNTVFTDTKGHWYEQDVQALYEAGIIKGTSATTFNPKGQLTRQQAAMLMGRILQYVAYDVTTLPQSGYRDEASISKEAKSAVHLLKQLDIMAGSNGYFQPAKPLTRLQMAKILKRTLAIAELM